MVVDKPTQADNNDANESTEEHMTEAAPAPAADFVIGQIVIFQGYTALNEGDPALLNSGERVKIEKIEGDAYVCYSLDRKDEGGNLIGDQAFVDEIMATGDEADLPKAEAPKGKGGKGKGKGATKAAEAVQQELPATGPETQAEAPAEEAAPAPAKGKGATKVTPKADPEPSAKINPPVEAGPRIITDSESVSAILQANDDAVAAAKALVEQGERTDYTLGGVLHHIYSEGIFKSVLREDGTAYEGKRGFSDFVEQHLGVAYRKAMYLISIYTTFRRLDIDEARLATLGWAKAKELVRVARITNADGDEVGLERLEADFDELMDFAQNNPRDALNKHITSKYMDGRTDSEGRTKLTTFKFHLSGEAADTVTAAFDAAKMKVENNGDLNAVFEHIVGEWAILNADLSLDQVLAMVQNRFGVTLSVAEGEAGAATEEAREEATAGE